ncbi:MAG: PHP-associated domain-containing protein [Candidatus Poribacteria bacterium]
MRIKVDLHVHTSCSLDSLIKFDKLIETCDQNNVDCVAITDHNRIDCAIKLYEIAPSRIIVGEEIKTNAGEIIGLFLKEYIPPNLSPQKTINRIKEQGGLVYVPHPFDGLRGSVLKRQALEEIIDDVDIIEVFNSRNAFSYSNKKAYKLAKEKGLAIGVGSDAHSGLELGKAYVLVEQFSDAKDFLSKLHYAELYTKKTPVVFNLINKIYKTFRSMKRNIR